MKGTSEEGENERRIKRWNKQKWEGTENGKLGQKRRILVKEKGIKVTARGSLINSKM